jgi:hypothetical protein
VRIDGKHKQAVAWSEGSDAEEDADKQADQRTGSTSMSVRKQGHGGAAAIYASLCTDIL